MLCLILSEGNDMQLSTASYPTARQRHDMWHIDVTCIRSESLSSSYGASIYLCDATLGPTGSWKDFLARGVIRAAQTAGADRLVVASSGNHGRAIAWAAARNDMRARVLTYDDTAEHVVKQLEALGADVIRHADREQLYSALGEHIADGWYSATLTADARMSRHTPGAEGLAEIANAIAREVQDTSPIVVVPTCYGDGATEIEWSLRRQGGRPQMCLVRASEPEGEFAYSISTNWLTPQVSTLIATGAISMHFTSAEFEAGLRVIQSETGLLLDHAVGGLVPALAALQSHGHLVGKRPVVCVITGRRSAVVGHV
jgi:threonine synthase